MHDNADYNIVDFIDLINETLSSSFVEKWRFRFSERFLKHFQYKILHALSNQKPLKLTHLYNYLHKKCKYSEDQIIDFFDAIDIDIYRPFIQGSLKPL